MSSLSSSCSRLLAIDIGNSAIKLCLFTEGEPSSLFRVPATREGVQLLKSVYAPFGNQNNLQLDGIVIASGVPELNAEVTRLLDNISSCRDIEVLWVTRETLSSLLPLGDLNISSYAPHQLGADRLANLAGARLLQRLEEAPVHVAIIDIGTMTTIDLLCSNGIYKGGAIAPGPRKFQSLVSPPHAAQLYEVDIFEPPTTAIGQSTNQSLHHGLYYGYQGVLTNLLRRLTSALGWQYSSTAFILTGGDAEQTMPLLEHPSGCSPSSVKTEALLTMNGLHCIWKQKHCPNPVSLLYTV